MRKCEYSADVHKTMSLACTVTKTFFETAHRNYSSPLLTRTSNQYDDYSAKKQFHFVTDFGKIISGDPYIHYLRGEFTLLLCLLANRLECLPFETLVNHNLYSSKTRNKIKFCYYRKINIQRHKNIISGLNSKKKRFCSLQFFKNHKSI